MREKEYNKLVERARAMGLQVTEEGSVKADSFSGTPEQKAAFEKAAKEKDVVEMEKIITEIGGK